MDAKGKPAKVGIWQWGRGAMIVAVGLLAVLGVRAVDHLPAERMLWVAGSEGLLAVDTASVDVLLEIPTAQPLRAVAFDRARSLVWVLSDHDGLAALDFTGATVASATIPAPTGPDVLLRVDAPVGAVWLGTTDALYRFDTDATLRERIELAPGDRLRSLALDEARSRLWLATRDALTAYAPDGTPTHRIALSDLRAPGIAAIAFDPVHDALWVAARDRLLRYDGDGQRVFDASGPREVSHLASDGQGGAWLAAADALRHVDAFGTVDRVLRAPDHPIGEVRALAGNPDDGSVWLANAGRLRHYALDGTLLHSLEPDASGGHPRILANLDLPPGAAVRVAITEPPDGALVRDNPPPLGVTVEGLTVAPERIDLTANDADAPASCQPLDEGGFLCIPLEQFPQGDNEVVAAVENEAGTRFASESVVFELDSVPPPAPDASRIAVAQGDDGRVRVTGEAGSVEAGSEVVVTNPASGEVVVAIADASGSFQVLIAGQLSQRFLVLARDRAGNEGEAVEVTGAIPPAIVIPPDPATVAPALPAVGSPPLAERIEFLYTGADPIQREVAPGAIEARRVSVLRGAVRDRAGEPIPGVKVTVLRHPELGHTFTRADGVFDLAANGGGLLTVVYEKAGLLPAQRTVQTQWNDWYLADDVVMIPLDPRVTPIDLTDASRPFQVAQGSLVEDSDGRRQVTMLFPAGTTAEITRPDGSKLQLDRLDVRATEYTVGDTGPDAMPAPLPPSSAYTYAVELSVDQARQQGVKVDGKDVVFNQPAPFYVDNFLDFPTGAAVPVGYYNSDIAAWVPYPNGRIVEILREENGRAVLDVAGGGQPATAEELLTLGITEAELVQLAEVYEPGVSLWRVPLDHFSTWDHNWPFGPPPDAKRPEVDLPEVDELPDSDEENQCPGCVISPQAQSVGESIPIAGTPYALHYQSERAPGYKRNRMVIPLTGESIPASLQSVRLTVTIAGQREEHTLGAGPNLSHVFEWDGRDGMGREVTGATTALIELSYIYPCSYRPGDNGFGQFGSSATPIGTRDRCQGFVIQRPSEVSLAASLDHAYAAANWSMSVEHALDDVNDALFFGFGLRATLATSIIETVAGTGESGFSGDGGRAIEARLNRPSHVTTDANGDLYISDAGNKRVRRVTADGTIRTVAGTGSYRGFSLDGGLATQTDLSVPRGVSIDAAGMLYIADDSASRVRRVTPEGIIDTFAGAKTLGSFPPGGLAIGARLRFPYDVAASIDGSVYIADSGNDVIRRVTPDGRIATVAGTGTAGFSGDGGPATDAEINLATALALGPDGTLYIAERFADRIRRVTTDGTISTLAGVPDVRGFSGDGGAATAALLNSPEGVAVDAEGRVYISDSRNNRIRRVLANGVIQTIAGTGQPGFSGDGGPATRARLSRQVGIAVGADGSVYIADSDNNRIRRVVSRSGRQLTDGGLLVVPSEDGNSRFVFDRFGRHLRTEDALTGATVLAFARDAEGRLLAVNDGDGNVTTIERDATGQPTAVIAPHGQRTALTVDAAGHLTQAADPTGATWSMQYTNDGLLTAITHPNGVANTFEYDPDGRLLRDVDPEGGGWIVSRTALDTGTRTEMISGEGRVRSFTVERQSNGTRIYTDQAPDGTKTRRTYTDAGDTTITQPDGTVLFTREGPDPRFKMDAPVIAERRVTLPSGLAFLQTTNRAVSLANPSDALSLTSLTDTVTTNGRVEKAAYDAAARKWSFTSPQNRVVTLTVDGQSRPLTQTVAGLEPVATNYDTRGRPNFVLQGLGNDARLASFDYYDATAGDQAGFLRAITDPLGRETAFTYDGAGRVTSQTLPDGRTIGFQYDAQGNLTALTPPGRSAHLFDYDSLNQATAYTPPDLAGINTITRYRYNLDRQVTAIERPGGALIEFAYDSGGRVASRTIPTGVDTYGYDASTGQLSVIDTSDGIGLAFEWDGMLPKATTWRGPVSGSVTRSFDANFWLTQETVEGDTVNFAYDADGLLMQAGDLSLARDPGNGLVTGVLLGSINDARAYNGFGELVDRNVTVVGAPAYQVDYTRDPLGRISEQSETLGAITATLAYDYDVAGRLNEVRRNGAVIERYTFDANSNRSTKTTPGGTIIYSYDAQDRLLEASGTNGVTSYAYTEAGDLRAKTTAAGTTAYDYDAVGNLRTVVLPNGKNITYLIDGQDRRIGKQVDGVLVQGWLYRDQLNPVTELDGQGNPVARFVYADQANVPAYMVKNGVTYRIVSDHLGSVRLVIDTFTGAIAQRMDYDAFGNVITDTNPGFQPFGFAGGLYDLDTGLVRFGARDYDAETARWTAKDPIGFGGGDPNLYGYVLLDPVNLSDPDGQIIPLIVGGAVIGATINGLAQIASNIASGQSVTSGLGGAIASGALSGAVGAVAGPLGGTIARALGGRAVGLASRALTTGISAAGGALGQALQNALSSCNAGNPANAAVFSGIGGLAASFLPNSVATTLRQASHFAPTTVGGFLRSPAGAGAAGVSSGIGAGSFLGGSGGSPSCECM
ncbi:MAG: RHS repeat-associated core domain-containing protein [Xanthomonadaceae bacterium]|nr:RHS repeat-associated core domain-containing protein [Xanthomonadaceae bacterium]